VISGLLAGLAITIMMLNMIPVYLNIIAYKIPDLVISMKRCFSTRALAWAEAANSGVFVPKP
jgi:hypothetical protein